MLNSEVNLLSSTFLLTVAAGKAPQFTTAAPMGMGSTGFYNIPSNSYTSPVRDTTKQPGFWSNPNHISLSNNYNQSFYNIPQKPMYSTMTQFQNQPIAPTGQFYPTSNNIYSPTRQFSPPRQYSPVRQSSPFRNEFTTSMYNAPMSGGGDYGVGQLLNNINKVLTPSVAPPHPPYGTQNAYAPLPNYGFAATRPSYNTFDRGSTFTPSFNEGIHHSPSRHYFPAHVPVHAPVPAPVPAYGKPPLYARPKSVSQQRSPPRDQFGYDGNFNEYSRKPLKETTTFMKHTKL